MTLNLKAKIYTDETSARKHLEAIQWPEGPVCPHCGVINEATLLEGKSTRPGVYKCRPCQQPFSVTVGTVMERSKIPLTKWLLATELLTSSKKGISAHQMHRMLGVTYKSAWFLAHRIREAMAPVAGSEPPLGGAGKVVEADEAYIGKKDGKRKANAGYGHKRTVLSLVERGGKIRSFKIGSGKAEHVVPVVRANVDPASTLHTDGGRVYRSTGIKMDHEVVDHNVQYVREGKTGVVHTNTVFSEAISDMAYAVSIRNQYAHCAWDKTNGRLHFLDMEAAAAENGPADQATTVKRQINLALLREQETFLAYVQDCLFYLQAEHERRCKRKPEVDWKKPAKVLRPPKYILAPKLNDPSKLKGWRPKRTISQA